MSKSKMPVKVSGTRRVPKTVMSSDFRSGSDTFPVKKVNLGPKRPVKK